MSKKLIIYILIVCFATVSEIAKAQNFGAKVGATINGLKNRASDVQPGLQAGVYTRLGGDNPLNFKIEFLLTSKGANNWSSPRDRINLVYAELPLLFAVDLGFNLSLNAGFSPSILLIGTRRFTEDDQVNSGLINRDVRLMDYATLIGLEYQYDKEMFFGIRYNHSWIPLQDVVGPLVNERGLPLLRTFQLYVGYRLR